jgi:ribosome-associated protein
VDRDAVLEEIRANTDFSFSRSGGPGGQNVNKRDTKVTARLNIDSLQAAGAAGRERIRHRLSGRINSEGILVLQADGERSQIRNREEALERMEELILAALKPDPRPRRPTRPSRAAGERRLLGKKLRGRVKSGRGKPEGDGRD